ncbi:MAG: DUF362 domain-containing protein [Selenomonadaceae bacterium]|nr:DUF362 domain-containing protein [Selenomonadaceae bacterium]
MELTRRKFVKLAGLAGLVGLTGSLAGCGDKAAVKANTAVAESIPPADKATVYFTKTIDAEHLIAIYKKINSNIVGNVAIKLHTGEPNGPNILQPSLVKPFQAQIPNSTIIEANVAYGGPRANTDGHRRVLKQNGWTFCNVDIIDENGDINFPVSGGFHLQQVAMGAHLSQYDSLIALTHFKGHAMGGFGGSLKNIAIGCASGKKGKRQVHGLEDFGEWVLGEKLMELMADSGKAICDHFGRQIVFINVLQRLSVDCDCAGAGAAAPEMPDLGILASTDILAVDQASVDMIYNFPGNEKNSLIERIESRHGLRQLSAMAEHKMGTNKYELVTID